ncbi:MAG: enoyl-CoA hydratase-related protein [Kofleriaceae bacterium]
MEMVTITKDAPLAVITVNREKALNALSSQVLAELVQAVGELENDDAIRCVAITGAGAKAFIAGADISQMQPMTEAEAGVFVVNGAKIGDVIAQSKKPYIAAVNGFAFGGGCEIALCCDWIYAADTASFGQPEVKLGVIPGLGGTQRLARRVGVAKAKELGMTGDTVTAPEALAIRLVDKVVPAAELMATVKKTAERIAKNGPHAVAEVKRVIHEGQSLALDAALELEQDAFARCFATQDQKEGMSAFLSKPRRDAQFTGK